MSAQSVLQVTTLAALKAHAPLAAGLAAVFDAPPVRALRPYAQLEEPLLADWGAKDLQGREARLAVSLFDAGEGPARLRALAGEVEAAIEAMPRTLDEGWKIVSLIFVRGRTLRQGEGRWAATSEFRVRMLRLDS